MKKHQRLIKLKIMNKLKISFFFFFFIEKHKRSLKKILLFFNLNFIEVTHFGFYSLIWEILAGDKTKSTNPY